MAKSPHYKGNNAGGYGNPPVEHQFKGTPGPGRPKGSRSMTGAVRKVFGKKIKKTNKQGEVVGQVDAVDALAERALQLGLTGSVRANEIARQLAAELEPKEAEPVYADYSVLNSAELSVMIYIVEKLMGTLSDDSVSYEREFIEEYMERRSKSYSAEYLERLHAHGPLGFPHSKPYEPSDRPSLPRLSSHRRNYRDDDYDDDD